MRKLDECPLVRQRVGVVGVARDRRVYSRGSIAVGVSSGDSKGGAIAVLIVR